ncbi:MAG: type II toxin-antitoxin system VapB family antitoxin, partial [Gammaproteobacteria bacterium]
MRTTIRLDDALLKRAKREAARRHAYGARRAGIAAGHVPPRCAARGEESLASGQTDLGGGTLPGVDLDDPAALLDRM